MGLIGWIAARSQYYCSMAVPTLQCIAATAFASLPALQFSAAHIAIRWETSCTCFDYQMLLKLPL